MNLTFAHWLAGSAGLCAACFALHWLWGRHIRPLLESLYSVPALAQNEAIPLSVWPYVFIGLAIFGGLFFGGHVAGF